MSPNRSQAEEITLSLSIRGRVQGVGFRWSMCEAALALGLSGWVRNRRDGSVEALVHGPQDAVSAIVEWARKGPAGALVQAVDMQPGNPSVELAGFEQMPTA